MYVFLVIVTILLPTSAPKKFRIASTGQFSEPVCHKRAAETAASVTDGIRQRMPYAIIQTELGCSLLETRQT